MWNDFLGWLLDFDDGSVGKMLLFSLVVGLAIVFLFYLREYFRWHSLPRNSQMSGKPRGKGQALIGLRRMAHRRSMVRYLEDLYSLPDTRTERSE